MRIAEVIGSVTLSRVHPTLTGGRWLIAECERVCRAVQRPCEAVSVVLAARKRDRQLGEPRGHAVIDARRDDGAAFQRGPKAGC